MALTYSQMLPMGTRCPDFSLPDTQGRMVSLKDFQGCKTLLVMFICNHCPYVKHVRSTLARLAKEYQAKGVGAVAINSNDITRYREDAPDRMAAEVQAAGYTFPYLLDETQSVAKAFRAACTPDFYLFDAELKLVYRGRLDGSMPGSSVPSTGTELRAALDAVLAGKSVPADQKPSMGCNIKWKPGNEPDYFG